jgi:hypothetical protein
MVDDALGHDSSEDDCGETLFDESTADQVSLPPFSRDQCLVLLPGGDVEVWDRIPRRSKAPRALILHDGFVTVRDGHQHNSFSTALSNLGQLGDLPRGTRLRLVVIAARTKAPRTRSRTYVMASDSFDRLVGWIDCSPLDWPFEAGQLQALAELVGLEFLTESFATEAEFERAHPGWMG